MQYTRENLEKSQIKFNFEVSGEEWVDARKKAYEKNKNKFDVEGFRKGKVPQKVIENKYGTGVFFEDALDILLPVAYQKALDENKEDIPVARPDVALEAISDAEVKFAITITVKPEIEVGQYTGLEIKKIVKEVKDEDVEAQVKQAQNNAGSWEEVDRAVENGDTVNLNYSGSVDGVKFDGGTAENQDLVIGSGTFIPGFEDQLIGKKVGEEVDVKVTFPEQYQAENLAGKEAIFACKINAIKVKVLPELDDEFAKDVSEFDTLEAYKADVKANLQKSADAQADSEMQQAIIDNIIENTTMEIPDSMVEGQIDEMVNEFSMRLQYQGMKFEDYLKYTGAKMEDIRAQYKETAFKNIQIKLVLDAITKKEDFKVEDADMDSKIEEMAKQMNQSVEDFKKNLNDQYNEYIKNLVISDKLFAFLKENNKFVD